MFGTTIFLYAWSGMCVSFICTSISFTIISVQNNVRARKRVKEEEVEIIQEEKEIQADANELARMHASLARERVERCRKVDWLEACDRVGKAGARRRRLRRLQDEDSSVPKFDFMEEALLDSDDPAVFYDENCLRLYRIKFDGDVTFPYHASQLLHAGGQQTMALFIQHGAMRDADHYFCSIAKLMLEQNHRPFKDILVIAPNFEYKRDYKVYPYDAFWNSTKVGVTLSYYYV